MISAPAPSACLSPRDPRLVQTFLPRQGVAHVCSCGVHLMQAACMPLQQAQASMAVSMSPTHIYTVQDRPGRWVPVRRPPWPQLLISQAVLARTRAHARLHMHTQIHRRTQIQIAHHTYHPFLSPSLAVKDWAERRLLSPMKLPALPNTLPKRLLETGGARRLNCSA